MRAASRGMNASRQQWMSYLASAASGSRDGAIAGVVAGGLIGAAISLSDNLLFYKPAPVGFVRGGQPVLLVPTPEAEEAGVYVALREMQSYRDAHPGAYDRAAFLTQRMMTLVDNFKRKRDRGGDGVREIALMTRTAMRADVLWRALAKRSFGDARSRDVFNRNIYQAARAADATSAVSVTHSLHGITAATGSAKGDSLPFEMVKLNAVETAADSYAGRLDIMINDGTDASAGVKVAELSSANAKFVAATMSADFGSSYSAAFTKGVGQDGSTTATVQTLSTGGSGTAVQLNATSDRLFVKAANTDLSGVLTVQGDGIQFYQANGGSGAKCDTSITYDYMHGTGLAGTSYSNMLINLDGTNLLGNACAAGSIQVNSFNATGANEPVLTLGAGNTAGQQTVDFSNSDMGIGIAASHTYKLNVAGDTRFGGNSLVTGKLTVSGDLEVNGDLTTISTSTVNVEDKNIVLGNGNTNVGQLDAGGLTLGTTSPVTWNYSDSLKAWDANVNVSVDNGKSYFVDGGTDTTADTGATLAATGLTFGADTAALALGTAVTLNQSTLQFASDDATLKFGTAATIDKSGFSSTSTDFALFLGPLKQWKLTREVIDSFDMLSMSFCADGTVASPVYQIKFSVSA
ncbi:hypothetical protein JKP88DRAFT_255190 [Tribonema minus]|uniref:Uncharacterized protein n=1 Tax=Tribonema minus TaxID=303371 RepID=A0A836CGX4_9STRA|nr:hypothetical protein JKP88DRAFT_255190 [Tribonema minus]